MADALIVAKDPDTGFARDVQGQLRGVKVEVAATLPPGERRPVLLVWSSAQPVSAEDVPALVELWSEGRLVIARRDTTALPLGLGDLETLPPATGPREAAFKLLHAALAPGQGPVPSIELAPTAPTPMVPPSASPIPASSAPKGRAGRIWAAVAVVLLLATGAAVQQFLAHRAPPPMLPPPLDAPPPPARDPPTQPHPSQGPTLAELDEAIAQMERQLVEAEARLQSDSARPGGRADVERLRQNLADLRDMRSAAATPPPPTFTPPPRDVPEPTRPPPYYVAPSNRLLDVVLAAAIGGLVVLLGGLGLSLVRRRRAPPVAAPQAPRAASLPPVDPPPTEGMGEVLFVSYAHRDLPRVDPIVADIEALGRPVWIDRRAIVGGPGWAGQIARAIKSSRAVVLMASPSSYGSDQVVRELYLAMNARKRIVPIELEPAIMPDELEYILAPFQRHVVNDGDRRSMLAKALDRI